MSEYGWGVDAQEKKRKLNRLIANFSVGLGVFLLSFVMSEPAPYELYMLGLMTVALLFGLRLTRVSSVLLAVFTVFNLGGMISVMQMADVKSGPLYVAVSLFLALTSVFFAAFIEADYRRLRIIFNAYLLTASITAILGIAGYFGLIPGADIFTRYGRAKGAFEDPNVFGPFLVLPFTWCFYRCVRGRPRDIFIYLPLCCLLIPAILVSFSRATWIMTSIAVMFVFTIVFLKMQSNRARFYLVLVGLSTIISALVSILLLLQIPDVQSFFLERMQLQEYDSDRHGRFARHWDGMLYAMEHPLGIGPLVFAPLFGEDTHNIWLKAALDYGWIGFFAFVMLTGLTLGLGFKFLLRQRPWQPFLLCTYATYLSHVLIGNVIDTDHWRHFYLLLGIIWGCIGLEYKYSQTRRASYGISPNRQVYVTE